MTARTDGENVPVFGHFHQKCGDKVALSEGRTVASGRTYSAFDPFPPPPITFSNDPIPKGAQFSVKVLQESKDYVSLEVQNVRVGGAVGGVIGSFRRVNRDVEG